MRHLALLLLLPACGLADDADNYYMEVRASARTQPTYPVVGSGLRFGMDSIQVEQHLDSLRQRDELGWQLSAERVPAQYAPHYEASKLVQLQMLLEANPSPDGLAYLEIQRNLREACGDNGHLHHKGGDVARSWFKGGTEIMLVPWLEVNLLEVTFTDLHHAWVPTPQQMKDVQREMRGHR